MSDPTGDHVDALEEDLEVESNYKPPPEKTIEQILETDKEDESLRKYKETLLGEAKAGGIIVGEGLFFTCSQYFLCDVCIYILYVNYIFEVFLHFLF